jgi:selenophosphate synthetase-related protein
VALFAESTGRFVLEVAPDDLHLLEDVLDDAIVVLGEVTDDPVLSIADLEPIDVSELLGAFQSHGVHS